jgi:hypothetical protein
MMIDKATHLHLTHATGNNFTRRKRAGEVSAVAGKSDSAIGIEHTPGEPVNFVVDFVNERWVEFEGLSPQNALG